MNETVEIVVSDLPFVVRRTVRWTDCDPAGAVYTGRFTEYLLGAATHFLRSVRKTGVAVGDAEDIGLPCKHMSLTFSVTLVPDDVVDIQVRVASIRTHSFDIVVKALLPDGRVAFEGVFSPICVLEASRQRTPIPTSLRLALERHTISERVSK